MVDWRGGWVFGSYARKFTVLLKSICIVRIFTRNCQGALRKKFDVVKAIGADVQIIQG